MKKFIKLTIIFAFFSGLGWYSLKDINRPVTYSTMSEAEILELYGDQQYFREHAHDKESGRNYSVNEFKNYCKTPGIKKDDFTIYGETDTVTYLNDELCLGFRFEKTYYSDFSYFNETMPIIDDDVYGAYFEYYNSFVIDSFDKTTNSYKSIDVRHILDTQYSDYDITHLQKNTRFYFSDLSIFIPDIVRKGYVVPVTINNQPYVSIPLFKKSDRIALKDSPIPNDVLVHDDLQIHLDQYMPDEPVYMLNVSLTNDDHILEQPIIHEIQEDFIPNTHLVDISLFLQKDLSKGFAPSDYFLNEADQSQFVFSSFNRPHQLPLCRPKETEALGSKCEQLDKQLIFVDYNLDLYIDEEYETRDTPFDDIAQQIYGKTIANKSLALSIPENTSIEAILNLFDVEDVDYKRIYVDISSWKEYNDRLEKSNKLSDEFITELDELHKKRGNK